MGVHEASEPHCKLKESKAGRRQAQGRIGKDMMVSRDLERDALCKLKASLHPRQAVASLSRAMYGRPGTGRPDALHGLTQEDRLPCPGQATATRGEDTMDIQMV